MRSILLIATGLAALLLSAGTVAALPTDAASNAGNAPVDAGAEHANEHAEEAAPAENASSNGEADTDGPAVAADAKDRRGPPVDLPAAVPDHVGEVHGMINRFLDGDLEDSLGAAISDLTPDDEREDESVTENESAQSPQTPSAADAGGEGAVA